jgi:hypothetical protein
VAPPTAEEQLVFIGLHYPAHRERIAAALSPEEIRDPILQRIFVEFVRQGTPASQGGGARPMSLQPPEVQRRLSSLWAAAGDDAFLPSGEAAVAQTVDDCLAHLAERRARAERTTLRQALEAADRQGDRERALKLLSEHPSMKGSEKTT